MTTSTTSALPGESAGSHRFAATGSTGPSLWATVAAEWMKLRAMRSAWVVGTVGILLGVAVSSVVAVAVGATWDDWSPADRADFDPIVSPLVGSIFSGVLIVVLGVKVGAAEYSGGLARLTFAATPRRGRVLAAKSVLVALVTWVASGLATVAMFVAAQLVYRGFGMTTASFGDGDAVQAVATTVGLSPLFPLLGLALAMVFRSAAGAIAAILALLFAPAIVGELLPRWWQENVIACLPNPASDSIAFSHIDAETPYLPVGVAAVVVVAWLAGFLGAAYRAVTARDA